jgi:putative acetyltransferase
MGHTAVIIRREGAEDLPAIRGVLTSTFPTRDETELVDELRAAGALPVSLVASISGSMVGHIAFSPVSIVPPALTAPVWALAPLAVAPAAQRQGIGSELVRAGLLACEEAGCGAVVVLGHPGYYPRFGFRPAAEWKLRCRFDSPPESFMLVTLGGHTVARSGGVVHFHPAFDRWLPMDDKSSERNASRSL